MRSSQFESSPARDNRTEVKSKLHRRERRKNCLQSDAILNKDSFAAPIQFNYQDGSPTYRSAKGACINLFFSFITLVYTAQQFIVLYQRNGTSFTSSLQRDYLEEYATFTAEDGFHIGFAVYIDLEDIDESTIDPAAIALIEQYGSILTVDAGQVGTVMDEDLGVPTEFLNQFEINHCSDADLAKFYEPSQSSQLVYYTLQEQFYCFDHSDLKIQGDSQKTILSSQPFIRMRIHESLCLENVEGAPCRVSPQNEQLLAKTFFVLIQNSESFDQEDYSSSDPIVRNSIVSFSRIPTIAETKYLSVTQNIVSLEDNIGMAIAGITSSETSYFTVDKASADLRSLTGAYNSRLEILFSLSRDVTKIERSVYNLFDLLGDVGGFSGILFSIGAAINGVINFQNSENFLAHSLYTAQTPEGQTQLEPLKQSAIREYLQGLLPTFCLSTQCLRKRKHDIYFEKARERFADEMDLVKMIQALRFFNAALQTLLPSEHAKYLKLKTQKLPLVDGSNYLVVDSGGVEMGHVDRQMIRDGSQSRSSEQLATYADIQTALAQNGNGQADEDSFDPLSGSKGQGTRQSFKSRQDVTHGLQNSSTWSRKHHNRLQSQDKQQLPVRQSRLGQPQSQSDFLEDVKD